MKKFLLSGLMIASLALAGAGFALFGGPPNPYDEGGLNDECQDIVDAIPQDFEGNKYNCEF